MLNEAMQKFEHFWYQKFVRNYFETGKIFKCKSVFLLTSSLVYQFGGSVKSLIFFKSSMQSKCGYTIFACCRKNGNRSVGCPENIQGYVPVLFLFINTCIMIHQTLK